MCFYDNPGPAKRFEKQFINLDKDFFIILI